MIDVLATSMQELAAAHQALADYVARNGRAAPPSMVLERDRLAMLIRRHSQTFPDRHLDDVVSGPDHALVTYTEAATALGVSTRTIGRHVAAGQLAKVGRRVTRTSVTALSMGQSA